MRIERTIDINDEPWVSTSTGKRKAKIIYNGPRFIYLEIDELARVQAVTHIAESESDMKTALSKLTPIPGRQICEVSAEHALLAACYFWGGSYKLEVENYSETLPNGQIYTYAYMDEAQVGEIWDFNKMVWNVNKNDFESYIFVTAPVSDAEILESTDRIISLVQQSLKENLSLTSENKDKLNQYILELNQVKTDIASGIENWKLSYPICTVAY